MPQDVSQLLSGVGSKPGCCAATAPPSAKASEMKKLIVYPRYFYNVCKKRSETARIMP